MAATIKRNHHITLLFCAAVLITAGRCEDEVTSATPLARSEQCHDNYYKIGVGGGYGNFRGLSYRHSPDDTLLKECGRFLGLNVKNPQWINFDIFENLEVRSLDIESGNCRDGSNEDLVERYGCEVLETAYVEPRELEKLAHVRSLKTLTTILDNQELGGDLSHAFAKIIDETNLERLFVYNTPASIDLCILHPSLQKLRVFSGWIPLAQLPSDYLVITHYDRELGEYTFADGSRFAPSNREEHDYFRSLNTASGERDGSISIHPSNGSAQVLYEQISAEYDRICNQ